jgi:hypothetical protein
MYCRLPISMTHLLRSIVRRYKQSNVEFGRPDNRATHLALTAYSCAELLSIQDFEYHHLLNVLSLVVNVFSAVSAGKSLEVVEYSGWDVGIPYGWVITSLESAGANWQDVRDVGYMVVYSISWCHVKPQGDKPVLRGNSLLRKVDTTNISQTPWQQASRQRQLRLMAALSKRLSIEF